jgi:radical SAM superfamily enzyme
VKAIEKTAAYGLKTGSHIIFGLPGESRNEMMDQAAILSKLPLNNIKFHQLQIIKNTIIAVDYAKDPSQFDFFSLEEYIEFIIQFIEKLNPKFIVERFTGEVPPRFLAGPTWGLIRNDQINTMIEKKLEEMDSWQGKFFSL